MELLSYLENKLEPINSPVSNKPHLKLAAVLIPIYIDDKKMLFTKRTETLKQHQGQIAFPGGRYDDADETLAVTALRETEEEVGIKKDFIELKGRLKPFVSNSKHYVFPFVGFVSGTPSIKLNPLEVQECFFADLEHLLDPSTLKTGFFRGIVGKYYQVENYKIWGLTQLILSNFLTLVKEKS
ncbi:MAG: NUDIX hydrolase [Candidatus Heimdallarchaeaceae archaeon]